MERTKVVLATGNAGKVTRKEADKRLRECLVSQGRPVFAWSAWVMVRLFGWYFWKEKKENYESK